MTSRIQAVFYTLVVLGWVFCEVTYTAHYRLDGSDTNTRNSTRAIFAGGRYPGSKAVHFNQTDSYISTPQFVINKKNFTIACWIKLAFLTNYSQPIYGDWKHPLPQFNFGVARTGKLGFLRYRRLHDSWFGLNGGSVPLHKWTHVAVTWKQNERLVQLYIDAVEVMRKPFSLLVQFSRMSSHAYRIGNVGRKRDRQFYGAIMDLYVLDVALSPEELNQLRGFPNINTPIPAAVTLYENEVLKCRAEGLPSPHVTWLHNGQIVNNGTSLAILKIPKGGEKHEGSYKCVASNMLGETSKVVDITVEEYTSSPIYVSTLDAVGFALIGHVMYTVKHVPDPTLCMSYCNLLEESCDSFNFSSQHQVCELNNATKETHAADYKAVKAFIYYEKAGQSVKTGEAWCGK